MNPAELLLTGGVFLGVAVPLVAIAEAGHKPVDMDRYILSDSCPGVERCIIDTRTDAFLGMEPPGLDMP